MNNSISYLKLHFLELKYNLIIFSFSFLFIFLNCSFFTDQLIYIFIKPLLNITHLKYFIYTEITDIFILNFYLSFFFSILISIPFILIQLWFFLLQGLNKKENIKILNFFFLFYILNFNFIYICFIIIIPNYYIMVKYIVIIIFSNYYLNYL